MLRMLTSFSVKTSKEAAPLPIPAVMSPLRSRLLIYLVASCLDLIQHSRTHCGQTQSFSEPPER
jgi:hypothetical protein